MHKPTLNAEQLRDVVLALLSKAPEPKTQDELLATGPSIDMPHPHPPDALGRNWDIARARNVRGIASLRLAIDRAREAYDLADPADSRTDG
jgi:hypothetical protein